MQCLGQSAGILGDALLYSICDRMRRIHGDRVTGMHTGTLYVLHDARDQDIFAVADRIHFQLLTHQIFIDQHRMLLRIAVDDRHKLFHFRIGECDLHALPSQYIGRTHQYRIAQTVCHCLGFFRRKYGTAGRTRDLCLFQDAVKELTVFCSIHIFRLGPQDLNAHLHQRFRQFDGRLSAKLYHGTVRLFNIYDILHILRGQRFKIQLVRDVKVSADRLRVVIDDDRLISGSGKCPGRVYGAVIKFHTLSDPDGAGAQDHDLLAAVRFRQGFVLAVKDRVVIRCLCRKFRCTCIHGLKCRMDAKAIAQCLDVLFFFTGKSCDHVIRKFQTFCFAEQFFAQLFALQSGFHLGQDRDLVDEPVVHHRDPVDIFVRYALTYRLGDHKDPHIVHPLQPFEQLFFGQCGKVITAQAVYMLLQRTQCLHQTAFKIGADAHHLAGRLHLRRQGTFCRQELIERKTRHLHHAIVQCRLKARIGLAGHGVFDLIQGIAQRDLGGYLGDGITGRFGSQCRRTAHTRIDLDDTVFKTGGMQRKLYVTSARDAQGTDDVECRRTKHLVFLIR